MNKDSRISVSDLEQDLIHILCQIHKNLQHFLAETVVIKGTYLDSADVKQILKISDRTLHRWRRRKNIPYFKIGGKIYYPKSFFVRQYDGLQ